MNGGKSPSWYLKEQRMKYKNVAMVYIIFGIIFPDWKLNKRIKYQNSSIVDWIYEIILP